MIEMLMEEDLFTIRNLDPGATDSLGRPARAVTTTTVVPGRLEQMTSKEGEALTANEYRAFMPTGTAIRAGDEVDARGLTFEVDGEPSVERIPAFPVLDSLAVRLRRVGTVTVS